MELPAGITLKELKRYVRLNTQIRKITPLRDALNKKIKMVFGPLGLEVGKPYVFEDISVKLGEQKIFDEAAFIKAHPFEKFPEFYRTTPTFDLSLVPDTEKAPRFFVRRQTLQVTEVEVEMASVEINVEQSAA